MAKPSKKMLGSGMARRAADALTGRAAKLKAAEEAATGSGKKKINTSVKTKPTSKKKY